jgi:hypothetical protein
MINLDSKTQKEIEKLFIKDGLFYINYWSTDCDGCSSAGWKRFIDLPSLEKFINTMHENAEGVWGWELTDEFHLEEMEPRGYWGM